VADDHTGLVQDIRDIVEHLATIPQATLRHRAVALSLVCAIGCSALAGIARSQDVSPLDLYEDGALSLAAAGFQRLTQAEPGVVAHWYNLGAAQYRLGHDWRASAAWREALSLSPRNRHVQRAMELVPAPEPLSARRLMVPPVTTGEFLALALIIWVVGWTGLMAGRRVRRRWVVMLLASATMLIGAAGVQWWQDRARGIVLADLPLRVSPHERAPAVAPGPAGTAVWLGASRGRWVLVRAPQEVEGWLPRDAVVASGDYLSLP